MLIAMSALFFSEVFVYAAFTANSSSGFNIDYIEEIDYTASAINSKLKSTSNLKTITFDYDNGTNYEDIKLTGKPYVGFTNYTGSTPILSYIVKTESVSDIYFLCKDDIIAPSSCDRMFENLTTVKEIHLTNFNTANTTSMKYMFQSCTGPLDVTMGDCISTIYEYAFYKCTGLTSVLIPASITTIYPNAFTNCSNLTKVITPDVNAWAQIEFQTTFLEALVILSTSITSNPLSFAKKLYLTSDTDNPLTQITISTATEIGKFAFFNCEGLTEVTIGTSVTKVGQYAFYKCKGLTKVITPDIDKWASISFSNNSANPLEYAKKLYLASNTTNPLTQITISTTTKIGSYAFNSCTGLTSVTIGNRVTSIGSSAFYDCKNLTKVIISNINKWASISFNNAYSNPLCYAMNLYLATDTSNPLTQITISTATKIGNYAFYNAKCLTKVTIGGYVDSVGERSFSSCDNLTILTVNSANNKFHSIDNCVIETSSNTLIVGCKTSVIPNSVTTIGNSAFYYCHGLTSVTIPNSVTILGSYAFYGCRGLNSVTIPNSVTSISDYVFYQCSGLNSVTIPNSVTSVGGDAFYGCTGLTSVTIGNGLTKVASNAFDYCDALSKVIITDINAWAAIDFTNSKANPLYYAKNIYLATNPDVALTQITINTSREIGTYAFVNWLGTDVVVGDSVMIIGSNAFMTCVNLINVTIGSNVTNIDKGCFLECSYLTSVIFKNSTGWFVASSSSATSGTNLSSTDLSNTSTAANFLTITHNTKYWKRG